MKNPPTQANSTISITTPLGPDVLLLRSFTFQEELGRPFVLRAELQSTDDSLPLDSLIGQNAVIQINLPTYQQRYINGYISTFQQVGYSGELAEYRATIVPWLGLLAQTSNCRIFQNLSTTSIVQQVCAEAGFSDIQINFAAVNYPLIPFCVQYNETALDFVCRLLEEAGLYFYFSSTINSCTMVICDSTSKAPVFPGYEVIPYSPRTRGPAVNFEHIYEWVIEKEAHPVKFTVNDYNYTTPTTDLTSIALEPDAKQSGAYTRYQYPGNFAYANPQNGTSLELVGQKLAAARLHAHNVRRSFHRGTCNALGIAAGAQFTLSGYPRRDQNVPMMVTEMFLEISTPGYEILAAKESETSVDCKFQTLTIDHPFVPLQRTPKPRISGPQTAVVVGSGSTTDADKYGNVIVQFRWDQLGQSNEHSSCRIRVSQNSAGNGFGSMFVPYIGSEVIVSFEDGNPNRPMIIGRVYNGSELPPFNPQTSPNVSTITDASKLNSLTMDATDGAPSVLLKNNANFLEMAGSPSAPSVTLQNMDNKLTMDAAPAQPNIVLTDGTNSITFDAVAGTVDCSYEKAVSHWSWGDWSEWIGGFKVSDVLGVAWNFYIGAYTKIVVGAELSVNMGGKFEFGMPLFVKLMRGALIEKQAVRFDITKGKIKKHDFLYSLRTGTEFKAAVGPSEQLNVGSQEQLNAGQQSQLNAAPRQVISSSVREVSGSHVIDVGSQRKMAGNVREEVGKHSLSGGVLLRDAALISDG